MEIENLLHMVGFTLFRDKIVGIQLTKEKGKLLTLDIQIRDGGGWNLKRFQLERGEWKDVTQAHIYSGNEKPIAMITEVV